MIQVKTPGNLESTSNDLSPVQKSKDSIILMERSTKMILEGIAWKSPEVLPQIRPTSDSLNELSTTGDSSPGQGVHLTEISKHFNGGITGERISGDVAGAPASKEEQRIHQTIPMDEENHLKGKGTTSHSDQMERSLSNTKEINDAVGNVELKDVNNATNVRDAGEDLNSNRFIGILNQEKNQAKDQVQSQSQDNSSAQQHKGSKSSHQGGQHTTKEVIILSPDQKEKATQAGKVSKSTDNSVDKDLQANVELNEPREVQSVKSHNSQLNVIVNNKIPTQSQHNVDEHISVAQKIVDHAQVKVNGTKPRQGNGEYAGTQQNNGTGARNQQQNQFPQISNNFTRHTPQTQQSKQVYQDQIPPKDTNKNNIQQQPKKDVAQETAPFTVVQSYASRL
ncbi:hypothetical protein KY290_027466 [Solanum tuberosum]|uniref:Bifunctional endo-1,4-beta-xylanase xylA n=1 Tax=Solanum tuberosum TaxID=4113 RepID=A0ABQ7UFM9_SOLTU|nr:hypothetical protein KY290_027466 [Solanum tuberosum]